MAISQNSGIQDDSKRRQLDLRDEALNRTIWSLAAPAILSNLMFTAVFFCDTLIVGWLRDENFLAATVLVGPMMWLINGPFHALGDAATSLVSRCWGERDFGGARRYGGQSMCLAFLLTTAFFVTCWPLSYHIIRWLGASDLVIPLGGRYLRIVLLSIILGLPMIVANAIIRGTGDAITPMILTTIMNVVNVGASILLAFGAGPIPAFGLIGVAWGTVVARSLGGALALAVLVFSPKAAGLTLRDLVALSRRPFARVWRLTYPAIVDRLLSSFAHLVFIRMVAVLGTTVLAAHNIALHVESLAFMPAAGISVAVTTIVGQAIGARRAHIAELAVTRTLWWSGLMMGA
ncbi:MAG TPA: MATE family efflux transporter, partial [Sumerlaeia bacterium]|nr:MATE family efflux transporter [Sumerlaeia bacterium]